MGAMGASTCATLVLGYIEIQFYGKCKNKFGVSNKKYIEENWHRFLDNCCGAFDAKNIDPLKLFDILNLNDIHDNIEFKMKQYVPYLTSLDIMINKDNERS